MPLVLPPLQEAEMELRRAGSPQPVLTTAKAEGCAPVSRRDTVPVTPAMARPPILAAPMRSGTAAPADVLSCVGHAATSET